MGTRKVAYLTPFYFDDASCIGGGERYPHNIAAGVAEASNFDFHVEIISYGPESSRHDLRPGVTLRILKRSNRPINPLDAVSWELPGAIADADLVHIHMAYTRCNEMGMLVAKQQRKPVCLTDHGGTSSALGSGIGILELADCILPNSDFAASLLAKTTTPIRVIKGGVDAVHFCPPARRPDRDTLLFVGRLLPHKGIDRLIAALPPGLKLTVCGRPYYQPYYDMLKQLAAGKDIEFVTDADDDAILELYRRAWVNVLPSVYNDCYGNAHVAPELMGFTLQEAMACGTPAICSRVGGMPEYVRHGETGYIFDTYDQLSAMLARLASDPDLVESLGARAREVVVAEYDLRAVGARTLDVYRSLLERTEEAAA